MKPIKQIMIYPHKYVHDATLYLECLIVLSLRTACSCTSLDIMYHKKFQHWKFCHPLLSKERWKQCLFAHFKRKANYILLMCNGNKKLPICFVEWIWVIYCVIEVFRQCQARAMQPMSTLLTVQYVLWPWDSVTEETWVDKVFFLSLSLCIFVVSIFSSE